VRLLEPERDSLAMKLRVRLDSLRSELERGGGTANPAELLPRLRPLFESARADVGLSLANVRAILRPDQWELVPASIKSVQIGPRPGQRPGDAPRRP
jgi:hypothetical protein